MNKVLDITTMQIQRLHYEALKQLGEFTVSRKVQMMSPSTYADHVGLVIVKRSKISPEMLNKITSQKYINAILKRLGIL